MERVLALLVLPLVLALGLGTLLRLTDLNNEETVLVAGIGRLRHAHLALAPTSSRISSPGTATTRPGS